MKKLVEIIKEVNTVLIVCSQPLDFDSIASGIITKKYFESLGKIVRLLYPKQFGEDDLKRNSFLPFFDEIEDVDTWDFLNKKQFDALVFVDGPNIIQFYDAEKYEKKDPNYESYDIRIHIDHHQMSPEPLGTFTLKDSNASSTVEVILRDIISPGFLTKELTDLAIGAIISDTGNFQWKYTPETYRLAAMLLEKGANSQLFIEKIVASKTKRHYELLSWLIPLVDYDDELQSTFLYLTTDLIAKNMFTESDLRILKYAFLEDFARRIPEYPRGFLVTERIEGKVKVDARGSNLNNKIHLPQLFLLLGGNAGGHFNASGVSTEGNFDEVVEKLKARIREKLYEAR